MLLEIRNLHAAYQEDIYILNGVDIEVPEQRTVVVIGANGTGKSTLLNSVFGFLAPQQGKVIFKGEDITLLDPAGTMLMGIGFIPQGRSVFPFMSVMENLEMGCWPFRKDRHRVKRRIEWAFNRFPVLKERARTMVGSMSGGQQRLLEFAKALLPDPELLLVDEPSVGLSPLVAQEIYGELDAFRKEGRSILLIDQDIRAAMEIAEDVCIMELGKVKTRGQKQDFANDLDGLVRSWLV
jgi:branched-chain amino acid transport system ATP-binding protein